MNICIAYFTKFGNGKKCVDELSAMLEEKGHSVEKVNVQQKKPNQVPAAELYIFSSPTRAGQPTGKVMGFIKKGGFPENAQFGIISTGMDLSTGALKRLEGAAEKKGLQKAAKGIRIKLTGLKGPLAEGYRDTLKTFADELG